MSIKADAIWAPSPTTTRGQPTIISADPKGERIAYANNRSIFLRSIDNPSLSTQYTGHQAPTTVARFSPSGYYVASGDVSGTVRVWDCVGEGTTKGDYHIVNGRINDLAWDGDSQRIIAVGDGKERFGHCITAESGNSVGVIEGHSAPINCVAVRQQRPLRAVTGSDDTSLVFYHGAPFKFNTSLRGQHGRFVYGVAYAPDGGSFVSVGADRKVWVFDGKTGEVKGEIGGGEHKGSILGVSWSRDSRRFATCSADQTVKIWDAEAGKCTRTWRMGEEGSVSIPDQQVGIVWPAGRSDDMIISLSLDGNLNYLMDSVDTSGDKKRPVIQANQKNITSVAVSADAKTIWTGSSEGRVCSWNTATGAGELVDGETHTNYVSGMAASPDGRIYTVGWDDSLRSLDVSAKTFTGASSKTDGQPKGVTTIGNKTLVATHKGIEISIEGKKTGELKTKFTPSCIAASHGLVAVGADDNALHIYSISSNSLSTLKDIPEPASAITTLSFSPDGTHLAAGFASGKITVYISADWSVGISRWSSHAARITSIAWNKTGTYAASSSIDSNIYVWSVAKPGMRLNVSNAHQDGAQGVVWTDNDKKVVSVGGDACLKVWKVDLP